MDVPSTTVAPAEAKAKVLYCGVCGYPAEYCEYGPDVRKCVPWLKQHAAERVDSEEKMAQLLSINDAVHKRKPVASAADEAGAVVGSTEGGKTEGAVEEPKQAPKKPRAPKVVVSRQQRSKRKFLTVVSGLELYKVDAKEACSAFKKKFACGVSQGSDGIEIQGDVTFEVADFIADMWPQIDKKNVKFGDDGSKK